MGKELIEFPEWAKNLDEPSVTQLDSHTMRQLFYDWWDKEVEPVVSSAKRVSGYDGNSFYFSNRPHEDHTHDAYVVCVERKKDRTPEQVLEEIITSGLTMALVKEGKKVLGK